MINKINHHFYLKYSEEELKQWFYPLHISILSKAQGKISIKFPHKLFASWFMHSIKLNFERELSKCLGKYEAVYLISKEIKAVEEKLSERQYSKDSNELNKENLNLKNYNFENLLFNNKNKITLSIAKKVIKSNNSKHFPFLIYGKSGSGKTHLLNAMVNSYKENYLDEKICFARAKKFFSQENIFYKDLNYSAFFIDDLQDISSSAELQENFISFYELANSLKKFCAFSMDSHPTGSFKLNRKIQMRLSCGIMAELKKPDLDLRLRYILRESKKLILDINKEKALNLAQKYHDFRSIDGALNTLKAYTSLMPKKDDAFNLVLGLEGTKKIITPKEIIKHTAQYYNIDTKDIKGKARTRDISKARQMAVYLCRELIGLPFAQIGEFFDGRDHSSILYIVKKIQLLKQSDKDTNNELKDLKKMCIIKNNI